MLPIITTPNLFKLLDEYHVDLSASGSTLNIPLKNLILTYQNTSSTSVQISAAAKNVDAPVLTDIRRITVFNTSSIESPTLNNTTVSTRIVLDDLIYSQSQESHSMKIRQQDPFCVVKFIKSIIMQKEILLYSICCKIRMETAEWWQESFHG